MLSIAYHFLTDTDSDRMKNNLRIKPPISLDNGAGLANDGVMHRSKFKPRQYDKNISLY